MTVQSVHLQKFPEFQSIPFSEDTIKQMEFIRKICNAGLSIRKKNNIKARLPLSSILIAGDNILLNDELKNLIQDELNVKKVIFQSDLSQFDCTKIINIDASKVAKRIGKDFQTVLKQAKQGIYSELSDNQSRIGIIEIAGYEIANDEYEIQIKLNSLDENYTSLDGKYLIILDTKITKDLEMEGTARDFVRMVQNSRKERSLEITQKITLNLNFNGENITKEAILANIDYINEQILASSVSFEIADGIKFNDDLTFNFN